MRSMLAAILLVAALSLVCAPTAVRPHGGTPIVVDTDMGLDDARALYALLADDDLDIAAVVVTEGSASLDRGLANLFALLDAAGATHVPVFAGATLDAAPPWRETANSLGGTAEPSGGAATETPSPLEDLPALLERRGEVAYLALGPLGSLAELARDHREAFARISTICLPARSDPGGLHAWNLSVDPPAAKTVFENARAVVLVDVSAGRSAAEGLLASILRETPAARFARSTLLPGGNAPHGFLCDELAAAYAMDRSVAAAGVEPFRLEIRGATLSLVPDERGAVRLANIGDPASAAAVLRSRWEKGPHRDGAEAERAPVAAFLETFHGHLGPYVVLGYRMGRAALEATDCEGHFDISAEVHSFLEPPRSCLIDGVQLGAGCTLGKRNIEVAAEDGPAWGLFTAKNGKSALIRIRPEIPALVDSLIRSIGVERSGERLLECEPADLFTIETPSTGAKR